MDKGAFQAIAFLHGGASRSAQLVLRASFEIGWIPSRQENIRVIVSRDEKAGVLFALAAYGFWGISPIYWKALGGVNAFEILCHRAVWAVPVAWLLITWSRDWRAFRKAISLRSVLPTLLLTASIIGANWLLYIYAVITDNVLQASLGYFINPLVNVLLGMIFLKETLRPRQVLAVILAAAGTFNLAVRYGEFPWISLGLALTFGSYGLLRKTVRIGSVHGLFVETAILSPFALGFLFFLAAGGRGSFGTVDLKTTLLLCFAGLVTALPLASFTAGARRLKYSTIGIIQYISPTLQFLLAVFCYREPFTFVHFVTFALIWIGLALFMIDSLLPWGNAGARISD